MNHARTPLRHRAMLALIGLALVVRLLVPAGWMPASGAGFAITLCSGSGAETAWVDAYGTIHKRAPATAPDHPCAFAGIAAPMLGGDAPVAVLRPVAPVAMAALAQPLVAVGQGLAAPPPPATGPPATV